MSLKEALIKAGLAEEKKLDIPGRWVRCELHGLKGKLESSLLNPLTHGDVGTSCWEEEGGVFRVMPRGIDSQPDRFMSKFRKVLEEIKIAHPECEILWY